MGRCLQLEKDKLNFKPRTSVRSLAELERLLRDQLVKDEMSVVVSFFEPEQISRNDASYLQYLRAGGIRENGEGAH